METTIQVCGLTKRYGRSTALDGLDLTVTTGEVHGFLGPNGAGKTSTIRVLLGLLRPDGGRATLLGGDPWRDAVALHRRLAYVPGDVSLWPNLTGGEVIDLLGRLRGGLDRRRRADLLERFALDPTKKCRTYSKGNRQKVALIAALAADVELLLLDEPTSGLDPLMEAVFRERVADAARQGRTVLLSSHILAEVEALCDRVTIVRDGRTVESGTLAELRHLTRTTIVADLPASADVDAEPAGPTDPGAEPAGPTDPGAEPAGPTDPGLAGLAGVHGLAVDGARLRCEVEPDALPEVLRRLAEAGVRGLVSQPPTLEELFLRHYRSAGAPR